MNLSLKFVILFSILQVVQVENLYTLKDRYMQTKRIKNLQAFAANYTPYVYRNDDGHIYKGIEYLLIRTIAGKLNTNVTFQTISRENLATHWNPSTNFDIAFGGAFPHLLNNQNVTTSIPYLQDKLTWCIQRSGKIPIWVNFFFIIPLEMWIFFLFVSVILCGIIIYLLAPFDEYYKKRINRVDFIYCVALVVIPAYAATSSTCRIKTQRFRIFYWILLMVPFFFHQYIGAFLYQFMHYQFYYHQITTTEELISANFRLTGSIEVFKAIKHNPMYKEKMVDNFFICNNIDACLQHLKRSENYDMAVGDSQQHLLSSQSYSPSELYCFDESESIFTYQVSLLLKNGTELEVKSNRIIRNLFEAGIFSKWSKDFKRIQEIESDDAPSKMTLENILMLFIVVLGIGIPLAIISFCLELVAFGKSRKEKSRIWYFLDRICNPERLYLKLN